MRDRERDEAWIRDQARARRPGHVVYITPNAYDGGYEVRAIAEDGTVDFFVDYETIDAQEGTLFAKYL